MTTEHPSKILVIDIETISLECKKIIGIGTCTINSGRIEHPYSCLINPGQPYDLPPDSVHNITYEMSSSGRSFADIEDALIAEILDHCGYVAAYNSEFVRECLTAAFTKQHPGLDIKWIDILDMARNVLPPPHTLASVTANLGIVHRDGPDARDAAEVYLSILNMPPITRVYLNARYEDRERCKALKCTFDPARKQWWCDERRAHEMPPEWRIATRQTMKRDTS